MSEYLLSIGARYQHSNQRNIAPWLLAKERINSFDGINWSL
jgi:hypothetical protein